MTITNKFKLTLVPNPGSVQPSTQQASEGPLLLSPFTAEDMLKLRIAADHGDSEAMAALGLCFGSGAGVQQDLPQAIWWYRRAARLGNVGAMACLSCSYKYGYGVRKDTREARRWMHRAKQQMEQVSNSTA